MTKRILFLIFFSICFLYQAQQNLIQIKKEILSNVKTIQNNYENKSLSEIQISNFFCENFYCSICETDSLESSISNKQITNYLKDIIPFLEYKSLQKSKINYDSENQQYTLGFQTAKPDSKTGFEGAGALLTFIKKKWKIKILWNYDNPIKSFSQKTSNRYTTVKKQKKRLNKSLFYYQLLKFLSSSKTASPTA